MSRRLKRPELADYLHETAARDDADDSVELVAEIRLALAELRPEYQSVFVLFHEQGRSYEEIAEAHGRPVGTIKTWLHRTRLEVLTQLRRRGMVPAEANRTASDAIMKHMEPISELDPERPACQPAQAAVQRLLDGEAEWDSPDAATHRESCVACREELTLARSLSRLSAPVVVPAEMSTRILNASVSAHRRRRAARMAAVGLALAASVAIAIVVLRPPQPVTPEPAPLVAVPAPKNDVALATPQKPLGDSVSDARDAIVTLTKRTATEPRDRFTRSASGTEAG